MQACLCKTTLKFLREPSTARVLPQLLVTAMYRVRESLVILTRPWDSSERSAADHLLLAASGRSQICMRIQGWSV